MESTFPLGFPAPTAFYLVLYVATFALHQAFMHYVLAGSIYVTWGVVAPGRGPIPRIQQPAAGLLRDWLPFGLSAAITAGVAPLLFVQIVYPRHFYTANLLLSWRWMIVIPVLIVAFYFLYLLKSSAIHRWHYAIRVTIAAVVAVSFVFVGFCWTAVHLISSNEPAWPRIYVTGDVLLAPVAVTLRMLVWLGGAFATMPVIVGWQLAAKRRFIDHETLATEFHRLACCAMGGLGIAGIAALPYFLQAGETVRALVFGRFALPYLIAAIAGIGVQLAAWGVLLRASERRWLLAAATGGCLVTLLGVSVLREAVRLASVDIADLYPRHRDAGTIGGLGVFLAFTAVNAALIAGCIWLVRRGIARSAGESPHEPFDGNS